MSYELAPGIPLDRMLAALSTVESSSGRNNYPNFEPAFAPAESFVIEGRVVQGTGRYYREHVVEMWKLYGMASACSFSEWQILAVTAWERGMRGHPARLWAEPDYARLWVWRQLEYLRARFNCATVRDFADAWNSGNPRDANAVPDYVAKVEAAYGA